MTRTLREEADDLAAALDDLRRELRAALDPLLRAARLLDRLARRLTRA